MTTVKLTLMKYSDGARNTFSVGKKAIKYYDLIFENKVDYLIVQAALFILYKARDDDNSVRGKDEEAKMWIKYFQYYGYFLAGQSVKKPGIPTTLDDATST